MAMNYRLSPSDLTFLYDGCKHCFVLKVKYGIPQPSMPMPSIFSTIAYLQKEYYSGKRLEELCHGLPPGTITYGEKRVQSNTLKLPGCESTCYITGRFDIVAELDDGSFAILDFKTGTPSEEKTKLYSRQLHSYVAALENPAPDALKLSPITRLGLIYFTPDKCEKLDTTRQKFEGRLKCVEIQRNDYEFLTFLEETVSLLDGPLPDLQVDTCNWCKYHSNKLKLEKGLDQLRDEEKTSPKCPICESNMVRKSGKHGEFWSCIRYPDCIGARNI